MDIKDFQGIFKYKLYLPCVYVLNWLLMLIGPFLFPIVYQRYYLSAIGYLALRSTMTFVWTFIGCLKTNVLLSRQAQDKNGIQKMSELSSKDDKKQPLVGRTGQKQRDNRGQSFFFHAFIIPSYNEDQSLIESTLQQIARHSRATSSYLVFLAMEEHQAGSEQKAKKIINKFENEFKFIGFTIHQLKMYQQKGKAANVSWCAQHLEEDFLVPNQIDPNQVMLTIIDADSWVPQQYIQEVDSHLSTLADQRYTTVFQPCQMFTRNHMEVPAMSRTYDISHGMVQFSNLFSLFNTSFPLSNYSLSYQLAKQIGFWDTCPEAIGEDFHTTIKAFCKTRGKVRTISIFTPFNQVNIQTGKGYQADLAARFWQAQRHGRGCADAAYCLKQIFSKGMNWRLFVIFYQVMQITTLPGILPWCMIGSTSMSVYYYFNGTPAGMVDSVIVSALFNVCTLSFIVSFFMYYYTTRRASRVYYGLTSTGNFIYGAIEYILLFIPNLFLITVPSATIAAFRVAFGQNVYQVAEKKISKSKK